MSSRRYSVSAVAICLLILTSNALALPKTYESAKRPNFVFFLVDDLGWMDIGANGSSFYETPNIDRLAKEGVRFTQAYAASQHRRNRE